MLTYVPLDTLISSYVHYVVCHVRLSPSLLIIVWIDKVVLHEDSASAVSMCARMVYSVGIMCCGLSSISGYLCAGLVNGLEFEMIHKKFAIEI